MAKSRTTTSNAIPEGALVTVEVARAFYGCVEGETKTVRYDKGVRELIDGGFLKIVKK